MLTRISRLFKTEAAKTSALTNLGAEFERARSLNQQGQFTGATAICQKILQLQPDHFESLILLAEIAAKEGHPEQAIELYAKVIDLKPDHALAYYKQGNLLKDRNKMQAALASYNQAIALNPGYANAFCNRGVVMERLDRLDEAWDSYNQAIALNPDDALAYYNRGAVLRQLNRPEEALASYDQAIAVKPDYVESYCNRGILLVELKQWDAALASYNQGIEINPGFSPAYFYRGALLQERKQLDAALASYNRAVEINPDYAEACCNRGVLLIELRQWDDALASLDRAIALKPDFAEAYCNRGAVLAELQKHEAAAADFDSAVALKPDYADAFLNRAITLGRMKQFVASIASYDRALTLKPDSQFLLGERRYAKMSICDWNDLEFDVQRLTTGIEAGEPLSPPFHILALLDSPPLHLKVAQIWVREQCPPNDALDAIPPRARGDKIRIGYFSADFRSHAVSMLTAELFETHDRSRFEITAFAFGPEANDAMRSRLERAFDRFIDVRDQSDLEVALLTRKLGIDIAVDLGGFTAHSRPRIFALRAAPIQASYIGYLGTMGASYMDYLVADTTIIPAADHLHYSEKIIYLPSYQVNDSQRSIAERTFTREELNLPAAGFVFCCFNANYKITPATFTVWMRILRRVEGSVLCLYTDNEVAEQNLLKEAQRAGVDSQRMVFCKRLAVADYLARYRTMDLFLDTLPYNAGTTASDALWAGLPVLTCMGQGFAGRVAASLLNAIELPELITATPAQYENLAVHLATNPAHLSQIKQKLAQNRLKTSLFDTRSFTKHLEFAYTKIQERHQAGLLPEHIYVTPADS